MNYKIIENFIDKKTCFDLIKDADIFAKDDHVKVLNERLILPSSSLSFLKLINNSKSWKNLHEQLNSKEFLAILLKTLDIKKHSFEVTNFFFNYKPDKLLRKYKFLNSNKISTIGNINLLFYFLFKMFRFVIRKLKFTLTNKDYVELLYDYSKSPNGYKREIHRDSDARTIVFLIYLNDLEQSASGGNLKLYKYKNFNSKIPPRPLETDCELIETIPPKTGRLVTFLNSYDSLHSVSEMKNNNNFRHFLYGSFTLLGKKNILLKKSKGKLKTNFNIFE